MSRNECEHSPPPPPPLRALLSQVERDARRASALELVGNPLRFAPTTGQEREITQADGLIDGIKSEYVIADRGYDTHGSFVNESLRAGATPVISSRSDRRELRLYGERHLVECYIYKMKHYRHFFSRFDKLANTQAKLPTLRLWLK